MKILELIEKQDYRVNKKRVPLFQDFPTLKKAIKSPTIELPKEIATGCFEDFEAWMMMDHRK
jgi:hypothetical protein